MTRVEFMYVTSNDGIQQEVRHIQQTDLGDIDIAGLVDEFVYFLKGISYNDATIVREFGEKTDEMLGE